MSEKEFTHTTDQELLSQYYKNNDNRLLGVLLQRYTLLLLGVCMKYLKNEEAAKDAVQQIFLKVIHELKRYPVQYFKSWLYMIAKNFCLMKIREKHGREPVELSDKFHTAVDTFSTAELFEKDHTLSLIEEGLNELNEEQKQCITLFYLQKKTYQQVTEATGFNLLQVKSYIQNGKRNKIDC